MFRYGASIAEHLESLIVAMFFLLPGRHAGEGGDVDEILQSLVDGKKVKNFHKTDLIATHPLIYSILEDRVKSVLADLSETWIKRFLNFFEINIRL